MASILVSTRIAVMIILPFEFNLESIISKISSSSLPLPPTTAISILSIFFSALLPESFINSTLSPKLNFSRFCLVTLMASGFVSMDVLFLLFGQIRR